MDFEEIKKASDVVLGDITVDIERRNGSVYSVTLQDSEGNVVRFAKGDYGNLQVLVPAKPKMVARHVVTGAIKGIPVNEAFEDVFKAQERAGELRSVADDGIEITTKQVPDMPF